MRKSQREQKKKQGIPPKMSLSIYLEEWISQPKENPQDQL